MSGYGSCSSNSNSSRSNSGGSSDSNGGDFFPVFHRRRKGPESARYGTSNCSTSPTSFETICAVCKKPVIEDRTSVKTLEGSILHRECFCCSTCGKPLEIKKNDAASGIDEIIEGGNVPTYGTDLNGKYFCNEHLRSSKPSSIEYKELKSGYLFKQGRVVKNWKRRFFVLLPDLKQLRYYQKDSDDFTRNDDLFQSSNQSQSQSSTSSASSSSTSFSSPITTSTTSTTYTTTYTTQKDDLSSPLSLSSSSSSSLSSQQQQSTNSTTNTSSLTPVSQPITIKQSKQSNLASSPGGSTESSSYDSPSGSPSGYQLIKGFIQSSPRKSQKTTKNKGFVDLEDVTGVVPASFSLKGVPGCPDGSCPGFQILARDRVWNMVCLDESERTLWISSIKYVVALPSTQSGSKKKRIRTQLFG